AIPHLLACLIGQAHKIGHVVLTLRVVVVDLVNKVAEHLRPKRQDASIAQANSPFFVAGVLVLTDRQQTLAIGDKAAIAGGVFRLKPKHSNVKSSVKPVEDSTEIAPAQQGVISVNHRDIAFGLLEKR